MLPVSLTSAHLADLVARVHDPPSGGKFAAPRRYLINRPVEIIPDVRVARPLAPPAQFGDRVEDLALAPAQVHGLKGRERVRMNPPADAARGHGGSANASPEFSRRFCFLWRHQ